MGEDANLQSTKVIAKIFGVSTRRVEQLKTDGIIKGQGKPTKYDLLPTIQAYIRYLSDKANGREKRETLADLEEAKLRAEVDIKEAKAKAAQMELKELYIRYLSDKANGREKRETLADLEEAKLRAEVDIKEAKAKAAQMELKELQGKMHRAEDVEAIISDHVFYLRSMLTALPGKLAVDLSGTHTAPEQAERVKQEVYYILHNLADFRYDPDEYKRRVMQRQGWENRESENEETDAGS